jgi:hypothetical protein
MPQHNPGIGAPNTIGGNGGGMPPLPKGHKPLTLPPVPSSGGSRHFAVSFLNMLLSLYSVSLRKEMDNKMLITGKLII